MKEEKMKINDLKKTLSNEMRTNDRYCNGLCTYNSGGNVILGEIPMLVDGVDCVLILDDDFNLGLYINKYTYEDLEPFFDEYSIEYFDENNFPNEIKPYVGKLLKDRMKYYTSMYGIDDPKTKIYEDCIDYHGKTYLDMLFGCIEEEEKKEITLNLTKRQKEILDGLVQFQKECESEDGDPNGELDLLVDILNQVRNG